jgi:adenylosuccinate synthase
MTGIARRMSNSANRRHHRTIRRVGWLDLEIVKTAVLLSGVTELCVTKLDVLSGLDNLQVCVGYKLDGKDMGYMDVDAYGLDKVELVYQKVKGWKEDISKVRSFEELPANAQNYIKMIEDAVGVPRSDWRRARVMRR